VEWYRSHLSSSTSSTSTLDAILISDDSDNVKKAISSGLLAFSIRDYVSGMQDSNRLLDLITSRSSSNNLSSEDKNSASSSKTVLYPEHLSAGSITAGMTSGILHRGYFNASPHNYLEATVKIQKFEKPVLIIGREAMNRSVDGDIVAIGILPKDQWKEKGSERVLDADKALRNDDAGEEGEEEDENSGEKGLGIEEEERTLEKDESENIKSTEGRELQPTGKVLGIIKRNWRSYVSHIDQTSLSSSSSSLLGVSTVFATPLDKKIPRVRIRTSQASILVGQKILIALDDWRSTSRYPDGHFIRSLGNTLDKNTEQESLLLENDVPYRPFSKAILDCLPIEGDDWKVPPKPANLSDHPSWRDREDLRTETICSIDPPGCQDIDDALHAKMLPNGNIQSGVHIADVSFFLKPETPMDIEAASRGVTVYLVDKRIDMLPHLLGTNLCSLRPFVERLAFSCIWEMDPKTADIISVRFTKSVIASKGAFTYEEAQRRKDDLSKKDEITTSIRLLNDLAIKLRNKRMENGALNLASPEVKIHLDSNESSGPIDVEQKEQFETNSLVEEFMLLANISVARKIYQTFPNTAVLRRHSPPPKTNFDLLKDVLKVRKGLDLDVTSSGKLAESLDICVDPNSKTFNTLVRIMATRCMLPAEYFSAGSISKDAFGHYGLAADIYTHFTSPIRRFADVLTHRQLAAAIEYQSLHPGLHDGNHVEEILKTVNKRHRGAQMAGRASVEFYVGLAITKKNLDMGAEDDDGNLKVGMGSVTLKEEAFVIKTFRNGLAVFVTRLVKRLSMGASILSTNC